MSTGKTTHEHPVCTRHSRNEPRALRVAQWCRGHARGGGQRLEARSESWDPTPRRAARPARRDPWPPRPRLERGLPAATKRPASAQTQCSREINSSLEHVFTERNRTHYDHRPRGEEDADYCARGWTTPYPGRALHPRGPCPESPAPPASHSPSSVPALHPGPHSSPSRQPSLPCSAP